MSTDRVAFVVLQVDGDVARAMGAMAAERDGVGVAQVRRPTVTNDPATLGTLVTGVNPLRHGAFTRQVPALGATQGSSPAMVEADLRTRNSRDFGAPTIWNRLSSRGVRTAVVGWPYDETRDDEQVHELGMRSVMGFARQNELTGPQAMLGAVKAMVEAEPEIGCVCVHGWYRDRGGADRSDEDATEGDTVEDDTADADENDLGDEEKTPDDVARGKGERVFGWFEALQEVSSSTHLLAILVAPRIARLILLGPRADGLDGSLPTLNSAVPTVLSLLGQPPAGDLPGRSIVESDGAEASDSGPSGSTWSIEGGETRPPDFDPSIARVLAGEGGDLLRQTVVRHLVQRHWIGLSQGKPSESIDAARRLVELNDSSVNRLRLVLSMIGTQESGQVSEEIAKLRERHPDSTITHLVSTLPVMRPSEEEVSAVLDRVPYEGLKGWLPRGVWARAAARAGRKDEAMMALWRLIIAGYAMNQDRVTFAKLAVERNQEHDAQRAVLATRGMNGLAAGREGRPRVGVALLRAKALTLAGRQPAAIRILEQFVKHHPLEEQAVKALEGLQRTVGTRPDTE